MSREGTQEGREEPAAGPGWPANDATAKGVRLPLQLPGAARQGTPLVERVWCRMERWRAGGVRGEGGGASARGLRGASGGGSGSSARTHKPGPTAALFPGHTRAFTRRGCSSSLRRPFHTTSRYYGRSAAHRSLTLELLMRGAPEGSGVAGTPLARGSNTVSVLSEGVAVDGDGVAVEVAAAAPQDRLYDGLERFGPGEPGGEDAPPGLPGPTTLVVGGPSTPPSAWPRVLLPVPAAQVESSWRSVPPGPAASTLLGCAGGTRCWGTRPRTSWAVARGRAVDGRVRDCPSRGWTRGWPASRASGGARGQGSPRGPAHGVWALGGGTQPAAADVNGGDRRHRWSRAHSGSKAPCCGSVGGGLDSGSAHCDVVETAARSSCRCRAAHFRRGGASKPGATRGLPVLLYGAGGTDVAIVKSRSAAAATETRRPSRRFQRRPPLSWRGGRVPPVGRSPSPQGGRREHESDE